MQNLDRSFESALEAVLAAGKHRRDQNSNIETLLKKLVDIGYTNQFSPEDRVNARKAIKDAVAAHLHSTIDRNSQE